LSTAGVSSDKGDNQPIKVTIVVQSHLEKNTANKYWQSSVEYLDSSIQGYVFNIIVVSTLDESLLHKVVKNKRADYVVSQPITTVEINRLFGANIELTKVDKSGVDRMGSVIFTSSNNSSINSIEALKGNSFASTSSNCLGGWVLPINHFRDLDIDPDSDFSSISFLGSQPSVVSAVVNGLVDFGAVRTGVIEKMITQGVIERNQIKVLDKKQDFPYLVSTALVPEWSFSSLKHSDSKLTKKILSALLEYSVNGKKQWRDALDYEGVRTLMRKHRVGIYQDPGHIVFYKKNYQVVLLILLLIGYIIVVIKSRKDREIDRYKAELERLSKASSVNQLLSEVTHELSQPITSLKIDAHMLNDLIKGDNTCQSSQVRDITSGLREKTDHCVSLILNIRQFLSDSVVKVEEFYVNKNVERIIRMLSNDLKEADINCKVSLATQQEKIKMSRVELDQVLLNLSTNAISAMRGNHKLSNTLSIEVDTKDDVVTIIVSDTGCEIFDRDNLFTLFKSHKEKTDTEGLGVGLSLSRRIIRSYDGELSLLSSSEKGSQFLITLPIVKHE
jgi:two-component system sensor histidine kinase TtrS